MASVLAKDAATNSNSRRTKAILTCEGNIDDPDFPDRCESLFGNLEKVLSNGKSIKPQLILLFDSLPAKFCRQNTSLKMRALELSQNHI